jgi:hypothetical protein
MTNEPLQPWNGPDDTTQGDEGSAAYLLMAGIVCGLIIAIGSQALLGHFAERPELAQADPLMAQVIGVARWVGWVLAGGSLLGWLWQLGQSSKKH